VPCTFDELTTEQLMHVCLHGNEQDARASEDELDRRWGDSSVPTGIEITTAGMATLMAATQTAD